jgi:penicillin-binding protein 2
MAVFISEIANGGYRITPVINKDEVNKSKREKITSISDETLRVIQRALWGVVNEGGTGGRAKLEGIDVCGKTGTAQLSSVTASKDTHLLPKEQKEHAWFIGYAPYENPTIAFAIIVEHGGFGGEAAAPIAKKVLERYFGVDNGEEEARPLQTAQLKENAGKTISKN